MSVLPLTLWGTTALLPRHARLLADLWRARSRARAVLVDQSSHLSVADVLGRAVAVRARRSYRIAPSALAVTALVAAGALVLRAVSPTFQADAEPARSAELPSQPYGRWSGPYAASIDRGPALEPPSVVARAERVRAFTGAFFALYLAVWTRPYTGGAWPAHVTALDAAFTAGVLLAVWRLRVRTPLAPLAAVYAHLVAHVMPAPRTPFEWGVALVVVGFALLFGSLAVTYGLRSVSAEPSSSTTGDSA